MNAIYTAMALSCILTTVACGEVLSFDNEPVGKAPAGWSAGQTGAGEARWTIEAEKDAPSGKNVLKQSGQAAFPICIKDDSMLKDGFVEVKFKAISGKEDQAGGVLWRCQDSDNYYIARANALENNLTIYRTIKGKRVAFKSVNTPVKAGVWHVLRAEFSGNHFIILLNGEKLIETTDSSISSAGKIGVWTKADSVTVFDDFSFGSRLKQ